MRASNESVYSSKGSGVSTRTSNEQCSRELRTNSSACARFERTVFVRASNEQCLCTFRTNGAYSMRASNESVYVSNEQCLCELRTNHVCASFERTVFMRVSNEQCLVRIVLALLFVCPCLSVVVVGRLSRPARRNPLYALGVSDPLKPFTFDLINCFHFSARHSTVAAQ